MTAKTMAAKVGTIVGVYSGSQDRVTVAYRVIDVKQAYGCTRLLVRPIAGYGSCWIDASRAVDIRIEPEWETVKEVVA